MTKEVTLLYFAFKYDKKRKYAVEKNLLRIHSINFINLDFKSKGYPLMRYKE